MPARDSSNLVMPPLVIATVRSPVGAIIKSWARSSLRCYDVDDASLPEGTQLWRSGGEWDSILAVATRQGDCLRPVLVFKNPVPLWQSPLQIRDGPVASRTWAGLRRLILIHNPGLTGLLGELDRAVIQ